VFKIIISTEAREFVLSQARAGGYARPGLMIHRQGPIGEMTRLPSGETSWSIERPHAWRARVGDFTTIGEAANDVILVDGLPVWLALIPKAGELGVSVTLREQFLHVENIE